MIINASVIVLASVLLSSPLYCLAVTSCAAGYYYDSQVNSCLPQPICGVGFGINNGSCQLCWPVLFNDIADNLTPCLPLTNCSALLRCLLVASDGTVDNSCSDQAIGTSLSACSPASTPIPFFEASTTSTPPPSPTTTFNHVSQTEVELWVLSLLGVFLGLLAWLWKWYVARFQVFKHKDEAKIRQLARSDRLFNRLAVAEASSVLESRLDGRWRPVATRLLREHVEQPIVEYIDADTHGSPTSIKVGCMLAKWKDMRGLQRNVDELLDSLYALRYTRLVHEICEAIANSAMLSEYFNPEAHHAARTFIEEARVVGTNPLIQVNYANEDQNELPNESEPENQGGEGAVDARRRRYAEINVPGKAPKLSTVTFAEDVQQVPAEVSSDASLPQTSGLQKTSLHVPSDRASPSMSRKRELSSNFGSAASFSQATIVEDEEESNGGSPLPPDLPTGLYYAQIATNLQVPEQPQLLQSCSSPNFRASSTSPTRSGSSMRVAKAPRSHSNPQFTEDNQEEFL